MKVNTNALQQYANEMKPAISAMLETRDTVWQVANRLMEESIGERFRAPILIRGRDINHLAHEMIQLQLLLEQIAEAYEECENQVEEHAELDTHGIRRFPTGFVPIPKLPPLFLDTVPRENWIIGPRQWERWIHIAPWRPSPVHPVPHISPYCPYPYMVPGIGPDWWRPRNIFRVIWPHGPVFFGRSVPGITAVLGETDDPVAWRSLISTD